MTRIRLTGLLAFALVAVGSYLIVQGITPQIQGIIGGAWYMMVLAGFILVIVALYIGKR